MKISSLNVDRKIDSQSIQNRLAAELEERQELACWVNGSCGKNGSGGINVTAG